MLLLTALLPYGELLNKTSFDLSVVALDYTRALLPKNEIVFSYLLFQNHVFERVADCEPWTRFKCPSVHSPRQWKGKSFVAFFQNVASLNLNFSHSL